MGKKQFFFLQGIELILSRNHENYYSNKKV